MSLERVFKALVRLELSETDAQVYVYLITKGAQKAKTIAYALDISKQQLYRSLKHLQNKKIVSSTNEHPATFKALHFEETLDRLTKPKIKEAQQIEQNKEELLSIWRIQESD